MNDSKHPWMPPTQVVVLIVLVWLITVCCIGITYVWKRNMDTFALHDRTKMYGTVEKWALNQGGANDKLNLNEDLNNAFEKRIGQYQKNLESQNSNLWYQVMCMDNRETSIFKCFYCFIIPVIAKYHSFF